MNVSLDGGAVALVSCVSGYKFVVENSLYSRTNGEDSGVATTEVRRGRKPHSSLYPCLTEESSNRSR